MAAVVVDIVLAAVVLARKPVFVAVSGTVLGLKSVVQPFDIFIEAGNLRSSTLLAEHIEAVLAAQRWALQLFVRPVPRLAAQSANNIVAGRLGPIAGVAVQSQMRQRKRLSRINAFFSDSEIAQFT